MLRIALISTALVACGSSSNSCPSGDCDPYATFQACYDDHHNVESFPTPKAIEVCCIDHPIGSAAKNVVCGNDTQSCIDYVTANLVDPNDAMLSADITSACTAYPHDSGRT